MSKPIGTLSKVKRIACSDCPKTFEGKYMKPGTDGVVRCPDCQYRRNMKNSNARYKRHLKSRYGITVAEYNEMLLSQGGRCKICEQECSSGTLSVDHDHVTDEIRGLLCRKCNAGLGNLGDTLALLERAVLYLKKEL